MEKKEIETIIDEILKNSSSEIEKYKFDKTRLFWFYIGKIMQKTKGKADPKIVNELLIDKLEK